MVDGRLWAYLGLLRLDAVNRKPPLGVVQQPKVFIGFVDRHHICKPSGRTSPKR